MIMSIGVTESPFWLINMPFEVLGISLWCRLCHGRRPCGYLGPNEVSFLFISFRSRP